MEEEYYRITSQINPGSFKESVHTRLDRSQFTFKRSYHFRPTVFRLRSISVGIQTYVLITFDFDLSQIYQTH